MAMFLSRIKKALNLGTKSITQNGTYNASSDGYDGYSSVEVNVAGVTPTPITPSNASPAALTSGSAVTPSANGYAIESYSNISPYEGGAITSGGIYKATTSGYAIGEEPETLAAGSGTDDTIVNGKYYHAVGNGVAIQEYTNITPSNSSPVSLSSGEYYKPSAGGYAIASYAVVVPDNANPTYFPSDAMVRFDGYSGYVIRSYSSKTPSDSSPASVSSGAIIKASASGYLYSTIQPKVATGTFIRTTSSDNTINCGFAPDMIFLIKGSGTTTTISAGDFRAAYWKDWSTSYVVDDYRSSSGYYLKNEPVSDFFTFTSTGFVYAKASSSTYAGTVKYIAVKYS